MDALSDKRCSYLSGKGTRPHDPDRSNPKWYNPTLRTNAAFVKWDPSRDPTLDLDAESWGSLPHNNSDSCTLS